MKQPKSNNKQQSKQITKTKHQQIKTPQPENTKTQSKQIQYNIHIYKTNRIKNNTKKYKHKIAQNTQMPVIKK